jgi:hypothetical protein
VAAGGLGGDDVEARQRQYRIVQGGVEIYAGLVVPGDEVLREEAVGTDEPMHRLDGTATYALRCGSCAGARLSSIESCTPPGLPNENSGLPLA